MGHVLGGTLLIAGTTIGVGMLALPVATGEAGFLPAIAIYILCWLFMLCTGLLLLEVCSWMPKDSNLITMAQRLLGPIGKDVCWVVYLFLFVTVMIAHVVGGGAVLGEITNGKLPEWASMIVYVIVFSPVVYFGTKWVDRLNLTLISGVAISYFLFIAVSYDHVDVSLLKRSDWSKAWLALPVLFTAFTFQVIIPTLMTYMNRDVKKVRMTIIMGTTIPLLVYLVWEFLILGIIPAEGPHGLIVAAQKGWNAVMPLKELVGSPIVFGIGKAFAFFTMTTSYIALALAYLDFLADGLKVQKKGFKKVLLCFAVFAPPTLVALTYPHIFITALSYAGGFSCAILFGLFPPLMVWVGRYIKKYDKNPQIPGGKPFLFFLMLFVLVELGIEIGQEFLK
ncbi:MAG: tyrosine transporter [Parachlamydiales bacterium]|nr:tyrosine transporter [Verrucomicrobiota bacterium]MBX3718074.1 tyrosine transporter [Candidatus Acheromyda pituitae]